MFPNTASPFTETESSKLKWLINGLKRVLHVVLNASKGHKSASNCIIQTNSSIKQWNKIDNRQRIRYRDSEIERERDEHRDEAKKLPRGNYQMCTNYEALAGCLPVFYYSKTVLSAASQPVSAYFVSIENNNNIYNGSKLMTLLPNGQVVSYQP